MVIAGADGCRSGWVICRRHDDGVLDIQVVQALAEACKGLSILAIDMPIGLLETPRPGRECEGEARRRLPGKTSSIFPTPCRPALACTSYDEANALSKRLGIGLTRQTFHLFPKLREIDNLLCTRRDLRRVFHETHPELAFARMNDGRPVLAKKRKADGQNERRTLLARYGLAVETTRIKGACPDDVLDAVACCRTATLIAAGKAERLGPEDARDSRGLPMNIWF